MILFVRYFFSFVFFASALATSFTFAHAQTDVSPAQMRELAAQAVVRGEASTGYSITQALLHRDPNDAEALIIRARAARDLGRPQEAIQTAERAWALADTQSERFGASMVMAQALSTAGAKTQAQIWLRRAVQNAPSEEFKNVAIRDFRYVQRSNPWSTELSFSISPNSNINNGSARSSVKLFDLPFEFQLSGTAQALSGLQYSTGIATRYRLLETQRSQHDLVLQLDHTTYSMSKEAKALAPTAKGSDFAFSSASLSYIRRGFSSAGTNLPNQFELSVGRTLYAQKPFMEYARVGFTQNYVFAPGSFVFAGLTREKQRSLSIREDVDSWGLNTGVRVTLANQDRLTLSLFAKKSNSKGANLDYDQTTLSARYAFGKPVLGVAVDLGLSMSRKEHDLSQFTRFGRQDQSVSVDVTGVFRQIQYYGFSPSVTLSATKTDSNIGLYDSQGVGLRVGIQSSF